jgi:GH35 family endo-1,4-beta-xylanase
VGHAALGFSVGGTLLSHLVVLLSSATLALGGWHLGEGDVIDGWHQFGVGFLLVFGVLGRSQELPCLVFRRIPPMLARFTAALAVALLALPVKRSVSQGTLDSRAGLKSLKSAVGDRFLIGVGVSQRAFQDAKDAQLIVRHFQILTPENCMKPQWIHPNEHRWNFEAADRFVEFADANQLRLVGHCLVWAKDDRTADWMKMENGNPVSRETLLQRIREHVQTLVKRYSKTTTMWDVANEALADGGEEILRDSIYSHTTGIDFLVTAFQAARETDPDAILIYNDYNCHRPDKRKKLIQLLTELKMRNVPIDAVGLQGHFELNDGSLDDLRQTFDALQRLNVKVVISELDIDVVTRSRWYAENGKYRDELVNNDPYRDGLPSMIQESLSNQYVALFKLLDQYQDLIARVSFWNLHDDQSWLNHFPWRRTNHPLLFDRKRQPKPAFDAVYELLSKDDPQHSGVERRNENSRIAHRQLIRKSHHGKIGF